MDNKNQGMGMLPGYGSNDPGMNVGVNSGANSVISPYMNFDPAYLGMHEPQYIFPEGGGPKRRRFEQSFKEIGTALFAGAGLGGLYGTVQLREELRGKIMARNQLMTQSINTCSKAGSEFARNFGTAALMYSVFGVVITYFRGADDELNTIGAGTLTGLLFKSTAGTKPCLKGGAVGLGLSCLYAVCTSERLGFRSKIGLK